MQDDRVGVAIIGTGAWAGAIGGAMSTSSRARLVTCFDPVEEKREAFRRKFRCDQDRSLEDVLSRSDVAAVHLTTPNALHADQAVMAARHGKHVFVDKPIANTIADAERMIEACRDEEVVLMVGHHLRRLAGFRMIKELLDNGTIGDLVQVDANFSQNLGFALTPDAFRWRGDDSGCPSGALMTLGIHHADLFNHLFGPVTEAFSFFSKLYIPAPVEDVTKTILRFESGTLGYLGSNYASPKALWMYIYGTKANLQCTVTLQELPFEEYLLRWQMIDYDTTLHLFEKGRTGSRELQLTPGNPILEEIDEFADCVRNGNRPETDGPGALEALKLVRAAIESADSGRKVAVDSRPVK